MTTDEKVTYWITLSDEDLKVSSTMLANKYYLYVGFMCHQCIEIIFKAAYEKMKADTPPFTHDLMQIAEKGDFDSLLDDEQRDFIEQLSPLNIRTRYPDYKMNLAKELSEAVCSQIIENSKQLQQWTKEKILSIN